MTQTAMCDDAPAVTSQPLDHHLQMRTCHLLLLMHMGHHTALLRATNDMLHTTKAICQLCSSPSWSGPHIVAPTPERHDIRTWTIPQCQCSITQQSLVSTLCQLRHQCHAGVLLFFHSTT